LRDFNLAQLAEQIPAERIEVYAVNVNGETVGGLVGKTIWGWFEIAALWVDEKLRRGGLGSQLLQSGEAEAQLRGCMFARASTWEFQARDFYLRQGYVTYGWLAEYPPGHTVYYLRKDLAASEPH
jgi:GNAT superfamily N-acetyltransferase